MGWCAREVVLGARVDDARFDARARRWALDVDLGGRGAHGDADDDGGAAATAAAARGYDALVVASHDPSLAAALIDAQAAALRDDSAPRSAEVRLVCGERHLVCGERRARARASCARVCAATRSLSASADAGPLE